MPYPIKGSLGQAGITSYQLGREEEWELRAISFVITVPPPAASIQDLVFLDFRDPSGGIIYAQVVDKTSYASRYFLAANAEGMRWQVIHADMSSPPFRQDDSTYQSMSLPVITLTSGCTVNVYACNGQPAPPDDPILDLDTTVLIEELHLWVEDTLEAKFRQLPPPAPVGPYALVPGPNA